jgi:hypothetical protein
MVEHSRVNQRKQSDNEEVRRLKQPESQNILGKSESPSQGIPSLTVTPFRPRPVDHIALLKSTPSVEGRANLMQNLQKTYGNQYVQRVIESDQEADKLQGIKTRDMVSEHSRELPDELEGQLSSGARARTLEETAIDVGGTGSALNSLANSPVKTVGNAFKGLFSGFPSRATIRKQPEVEAAISSAWAQAQSDYSERFGWITWDKTNKTYAVPATSVGNPYSCTPPAKPADPANAEAPQVFHVGEFHIHPPLDPNKPDMADPKKWPIGPSDTDERAAQADNSPGIVRDFNSVNRTGGVTDYTYGPWTRTK